MKKTVQIMVTLSVGVFLLYPIFFVALGSIMGPNEIAENLSPLISNSDRFVKWSILPQSPSIHSIIELLLDTPEFFVMFWNSVKVSFITCLAQLLIAIPAAWGIANYDFRGRKMLYCLYLILALTPFVILMLPQYIILQNFQLIDTIWALILPGIFSTFPILIVHSFIKRIPPALFEMARIEGATEVYIFIHIGIPLVKGGIVLALLFSFVEQWSLFEQPLLFIETEWRWTLPLYLTNINLEHGNLAFVASLFTMILPILLLGLSKDKLENGLSDIFLKE